jgi:hypothetical protein
MSWVGYRRRYPDAVKDLCGFLEKKYGLEGGSFYFRDKYIFMVAREFSRVDYGDVLDWMAERWDIYLNLSTDILGGGVRFSYYLSYIEKGVLYRTPLVHGVNGYEEIIKKVAMEGLRAIQKRLVPKK